MIEAKLFAYELLEELKRDLPFLDFASLALPADEAEACVVAKAVGILAGAEEAAEFLKLLGFQLTKALPDGARVKPGDEVMCFKGPARDIPKVERTLLNLLIHASGVATYTRKLVDLARSLNPRLRVAATRKTLPHLRYIEKKAVLIGGGDPHRFSLSDAVMVKDTHLELADLNLLFSAPRSFIHKLEVEAKTAEEVLRAVELGADIVMLDNMPPEEVRRVHEELERRGLRGRVILEASGGIDERNIALYAPYVDVISMGRLTHSAPALDMSLEVRPSAVPVGLLGYGRLGAEAAKMITSDPELELVGVYDASPERCAEAEKAGLRCLPLEELVDKSEFVVEAASAEAVLQHGCAILERGGHLIVASVGALTKLPRCGTGLVFAISGAIGGLDLVAATRGEVRHVMHKHGAEEKGGEAEQLYWQMPRQLNSAVAIKLAGARRVDVEMKGDAPEGLIVHEIHIKHDAGQAYIRVENVARGTSSVVAAHSLYATLKSAVKLLKRRGKIVVGTFAVL